MIYAHPFVRDRRHFIPNVESDVKPAKVWLDLTPSIHLSFENPLSHDILQGLLNRGIRRGNLYFLEARCHATFRYPNGEFRLCSDSGTQCIRGVFGRHELLQCRTAGHCSRLRRMRRRNGVLHRHQSSHRQELRRQAETSHRVFPCDLEREYSHLLHLGESGRPRMQRHREIPNPQLNIRLRIFALGAALGG